MQNINQKKDNIVNKNIHYALSVRLKKYILKRAQITSWNKTTAKQT
jgi:hypothetical protein